jgi:hypothetical protein
MHASRSRAENMARPEELQRRAYLLRVAEFGGLMSFSSDCILVAFRGRNVSSSISPSSFEKPTEIVYERRNIDFPGR